jgi:hypothetical protein
MHLISLGRPLETVFWTNSPWYARVTATARLFVLITIIKCANSLKGQISDAVMTQLILGWLYQY